MRAGCLGVLLLILSLSGCSSGPVGPKPPSVDKLIAMLKENNVATQIEAADWIRDLGPQAAETAPALIAALKHSDDAVRLHAAAALGKLGPDTAATAVPALTTALKDPDMTVRRAAAVSLGEFGPAAASAIPALEELSKTPDRCAPAPVNAALQKIRKP